MDVFVFAASVRGVLVNFKDAIHLDNSASVTGRELTLSAKAPEVGRFDASDRAECDDFYLVRRKKTA